MLIEPPTHRIFALFRIAFYSVVLLDLLQLYRWRAVSFHGRPLVIAQLVLPLCLLLCVSIVLGYKTRFCAFALFLLSPVVLRGSIDDYHIRQVIEAVGFVMLFAPAPCALSIDSTLAAGGPDPARRVPRSFCWMMTTTLALIYFDSVVFKLHSPIWREGLAVWLSAALPHFSTGRLPEWLQVRSLMIGSSYATLALEMAFPLIILKRCRPYILAIGLALHLGISFLLPIPYFGLTMVAPYLLFIPTRSEQTSTSGENVVAERTRVAFIVVMCLSQIVLLRGGDRIPEVARLAAIMGIERHPVYIDPHFAIVRPILRFTLVDGKGRRYPLREYDDKGYPSVRGRYWVTCTFRWRWLDRHDLSLQVRRWAEGHARRLGIELTAAEIEYKNVSTPLRFDLTLVHEIERRPWIPGAVMRWRPGGGWQLEATDEFLVAMGR